MASSPKRSSGAREPLLDRLDDAGDRGSQRLRLLCQRGSEQESTENQQADQDQVEHEDNGDPRKTEASLQPIDERVDQVREDCGDDKGGEDMGEVEQGPAENERDERGDEKEFTGLPDTIEHVHAVRTRPVPALCLASGGRIARSTGAFYRSRTRVALRARTACREDSQSGSGAPMSPPAWIGSQGRSSRTRAGRVHGVPQWCSRWLATGRWQETAGQQREQGKRERERENR
jgi:hypothetical protein